MNQSILKLIQLEKINKAIEALDCYVDIPEELAAKKIELEQEINEDCTNLKINECQLITN